MMKIKMIFYLLLVLAISACQSNTQQAEDQSWEDIVEKINTMNDQFQYASIPVEEFAEEDKKKLLAASEEELAVLLQQMRDKLVATNQESKQFSDDQREKAEAFLNIVDPLLAEAESTEAYHRIVLEYQQYCQPDMVAQSREWIKTNVKEEDWGDI